MLQFRALVCITVQCPWMQWMNAVFGFQDNSVGTTLHGSSVVLINLARTLIKLIHHVKPVYLKLTLPYRSVVSCTRLTTSPCHLFRSSAALFSW